MHIASLPPAVHFINCNQYTVSQHLSCLLGGTAGDIVRPLKHLTKCTHPKSCQWVRQESVQAPAPRLPTGLTDWFLSHAYTFELHCFEFVHIAWNLCSRAL